MKSKRIILLAVMVTVIMVLTSCMINNPGNKPDNKPGNTPGNTPSDTPGNTSEKDNLIYNETSELYFIIEEGLNCSAVDSLFSALLSQRTETVSIAPPNSEKHTHEIVIGKTDREISRRAFDRMARLDKNTDDERNCLIYSDGSSIAIVWDDDEDGAVRDFVIEYFTEDFVSEELVAARGNLFSETIDLYEYYSEMDDVNTKSQWEQLEKNLGKDVADAMKRYYSVISPDVVIWLANLYDPSICVCKGLYGDEECSHTKYCGTGGFYYSNSARNTPGYLPDAESTGQALDFLAAMGLASNRGGGWTSVVTEDMKKQIGDFIYALEEDNGYFYHPQWGVEFTDRKLSRRARDLTWCCNILSALGRKPKYTTASGMKGEDVLGTSRTISLKLGQSKACAVSKVVLTSDDVYASHLKDLNSFKVYLASQDIRNSSYVVGNELTSQTSQIQARDKQIGTASNPTPLMDYLIEWLNQNQNPETGTWDWKTPGTSGYVPYYGVNGLMKISGISLQHQQQNKRLGMMLI